MKTYFTFGQGHAHAVNGKTFDKDCVVEIEAPTSEDARMIMFETFGEKWGLQYQSLEHVHMEYYPRGLMTI